MSVLNVNEKEVIIEVKNLLKAEFSKDNLPKFEVESYPISMNDYKLKPGNGTILIKEQGISVQLMRSDTNYFYYDNYAWSIINIGILILFQRSFIRQDRVTEISEVCERVRNCLQDHAIFNENLYVTNMSESVYDSSKNWYYRTIDVSFPYSVKVRK